MNIKDLRTKQTDELTGLLKETSEKIAKTQFEHFRSRSKNVKEIFGLRKTRARIMTLLREKQS